MSPNPLPQLLVIAGPTASGKSRLALEAAHALRGEIVNCDSMQMIRGMDVGTAKPSLQERLTLPHHLFDRINPDEFFSAGTYMNEARRICREIADRNRVPIVVGGTGLYLRALLEGVFAGPGKSEEIRARLVSVESRKGLSFLYHWLQRKDPVTASRLGRTDRPRIYRALEVLLQSGKPISLLQQQREHLSGFRIVKVGIELPREALYGRISRRVEAMFAEGLLQEVETLLSAGYSQEAKGFEALGYRHAIRILLGELTLREGIEETQRDTRRYAKRQMTWFRREGLLWIHGPGEAPRALADLLGIISRENSTNEI